MAKEKITAARIHQLLVYDPVTGSFTNRIDRKKAKAGETAGSLSPQGYVQITLDGSCYTAQSLAHLYMKHEWWPGDVDHINGNRADNRWVNLRTATHSQNQANGGAYRTNKSGVRGVSRSGTPGKWRADITVNGVRTYLGSFRTIMQASRARMNAALSLVGPHADPLSAIELYP